MDFLAEFLAAFLRRLFRREPPQPAKKDPGKIDLDRVKKEELEDIYE